MTRMRLARPSSTAAGAVIVVVGLALGACGGGSDDNPAKIVAPVTYVTSVCRAMLQWSNESDAAFNESEESPDFDTSAGIRQSLLRYFDPLQEVTDELRAQVVVAGVPDVPDGAAVARGLRDDLAAVSARLEANRDDWAAIPLTDVQPAASIEATMTVVGEQLEAVHKSVEPLRTHPRLRSAWDREPACTEFAEKQP